MSAFPLRTLTRHIVVMFTSVPRNLSFSGHGRSDN